MSVQSKNRYPSTKFAVLPDGENIASVKKNYFLWITVTLIFCTAVACFSYRLFISPTFFTDQRPQSFSINNTFDIVDEHKNLNLKLYNPGPLLIELKKRNQKYRTEFTCEESLIQLKTIPTIFIEQTLQKDFENLQDFINLDLLFHYENLINKFERKSLKLIFSEYQLKLLLLKKSGDFVNFLKSLKSNKFKFYANLLKQQKYNLKLKHFEGFFALTEELNHWYNYLHRLSSFLSNYEQQKFRKNLENCTEKNFEKFTEETQKRLFYFAFPFKMTEKKIQEINEIINMWLKPITIEYYNCSMILYRKVLLLSDIIEEIQRLNVSCLKYLYAFASHVIYLDSDLELLGVNLALVAPEWIFLKKTKINLNGITGREFTNGTASFNESGMPGNPGGHAGDFLGVGGLHENFLIISANGGKGGKGQNGAKGLDGIHYTRPDPPVSSPACVSKINIFNNSFGQTITHYKVFSPIGCGRSGTDGGVGGMGGAGGVITLINNSIKITKGLNGETGTPGKGGAGGTGGQNGCFYEVLDVDDEILHPITKVKCPGGNILPSGEYGKENYNSQGQFFLPEKENLTVQNTLYQFFRFSRQDLVKNNDPNVISFLKNLIQLDLCNKTCVRDILTEYKLLEMFDKIEFYEIFKEKVLKYMQHYPNDSQPVFKYLVPIVLEKMMNLKENVKFFFIDFKNYLNLVEKNIRTTSEQTRQMQSVSHFKIKVHNKIEEIQMNLNRIKMRSIVLTSNLNSVAKSKEKFFLRNNSKYLPEELNEKKITLIVTKTADALHILMNPVFGGVKQIRFGNSGFIEKDSILSQRIISYKNNSKMSTNLLTNTEKILQSILENLRNNNSQEIKKDLSKLKDALCSLKELGMLSHEIKNLLENLTDEIEHLVALYVFLEWEKLERLFFESLDSLTLNSNLDIREDEEIMFLKTRLVDAMITLQCKLAVHSAQLHLYSLKNMPTCLKLLQDKAIDSVITDHSNSLQSIGCENSDLFYKNHFKAVFDRFSAVGEFYYWSNAEIRNKLKNFFSGEEIKLKSDIINHHVFDKNCIQFRNLKLEFETGNMSYKHLQEILSHFKIEMIHSGYSYYNWREETYVFVSEKVNLEYSFRVQDNSEPEVYNSLYKKCQDGEIKLSPFTTWTLRLIPLKEATGFSKLMPFVNTVNLRLIGTGTYIT